MANLKFIIFSVLMLVLIGFIGYWAFHTIEPGDIHAAKEKQQELENKNQELETEVQKLKDQLAELQPPALSEPVDTMTNTTTDTSASTDNTPLKYQSLINDMQKLIDDKVVMQEKSKGTRVGTLQTFLNVYNNTSKKIDNDFGKTTKTDVIAFQKAVGLTADGQTGATTFQKIIDWLKKQG